MTLSIQKQKPLKDLLTADKSKNKNPLSKAEQLEVDELAQLNDWLKTMKPKQERFDSLKKGLNQIAIERFDKTVPAVLKGTLAEAEYSKVSDAREIHDMQGLIGKLKEKLGYEGLLQIIKVNLGDVDKYLTETEAKPFIKAVDGSRSLKATRLL